jgi:tripartite-type tricarboxylate transporter receptor subunit TctC
LLALAKSKPGKLNFASTGPGSMPHLAGELFKISAGIDIVHVPYKGAAPAVNDIIGQQVEMVFLDIPVLLPQVQSGKVKPIAIGSRERVPSLPNVPTTGEVGLPQIEAENWYGMVVPAATPPAVVAKLHKAAVDALKTAEVKDKLSSQGAILVGNTPEEFATYIQSEIDKWGKVAKAANIKAN